MSLEIVCLLFILSGMGLVSCGGLPKLIAPKTPHKSHQILSYCHGLYSKESYRLQHKIEFSLPGNNRSSMVGVTLVDSSNRRFRSVLLAVEGLTLFDATRDAEKLQIHRALPPLDSRAMGYGLMDDVALMLMPPASDPFEVGQMADGRMACRFVQADQQTIEVLVKSDFSYQLRLYSKRNKLVRKVEIGPPAIKGFPRNLRLQAFGPGAYSLDLTLLEADLLELSDELFEP